MRGLAKAGWGVACSLWLALPALADLTENFDASTGVPAGWTDGGTANDSVSGHYQSSPNCRAMGAGDTLQTPAVDYPSNLSFFVAASTAGNNKTGTVDYALSGTNWISFGTFVSSKIGGTKNFPLNASPNLAASPGVRFRFNSTFSTWYLDDVVVRTAAVAPSNSPPSLFLVPSQTNWAVEVGATVTVAVVATELDGDEVVLTGVDVPAGAVFAPNPATGLAPVTNMFTWVTSTGGSYAIAFQAADKDGTNEVVLNVTVSQPDFSLLLEEDFDDSGSVPVGWTDGGTANDSSHFQSAPNCRALGSNDVLTTPAVDFPTNLSFYVDASTAGNGQMAFAYYRIGTNAWSELGAFPAPTTGTNLSFSLLGVANVAASEDVQFRFHSPFNTWYLDDVLIRGHSLIDQPPALVPVGPQMVALSNTLTVAVVATDYDQDEITLYASNLPPGAVFDVATNAGGITNVLTYAPTEAEVGLVYTSTVYAADVNGIAEETFTISVFDRLVRFAAATTTVWEADGTVELAVVLSRPGDATVEVYTAGTATTGPDGDVQLAASTVTFAVDGSPTQWLKLAIAEDVNWEAVETLRLGLTNAVGTEVDNSGPSIVEIRDDDAAYFNAFDENPGWSKQGPWAFGQPTGSAGGGYNSDPASGCTGTNVYGYNLSGAYANNLSTVYYLTTPALDCSRFRNVRLSFQRWLGIEGSIYDHVFLQVSRDCNTWCDVWQNGTYTIADSSWTNAEFDVSAYVDGRSTVYVRWGLGPTDSAVTYCGWNIDDVALAGEYVTNSLFRFSEAGYSVRETATVANVEIERYGLTNDAAEIQFVAGNGTAMAGADFDAMAEAVVFAPGETNRTVSIPLWDDAEIEGNETIDLRLIPTATGETGTPAVATLIVQDDEMPGVSLPFFDGFEAGAWSNGWTSASSGNGRIQVGAGEVAPFEGAGHVLLDATNYAYGLNELVLTVDLAGQTNVMLEYQENNFDYWNEAMPEAFVGSTNADGVAISGDGIHWFKLCDPTARTGSYTNRLFDLSAAAASRGLALDANFQIKFQQYDYYSLPIFGRCFDAVQIYDPTKVADMQLGIQESEDPTTPGSNLIYRLVASNSGPLAVADVVVSNQLPIGATFVSAESSQGECAQEADCVVAHLGALAGGGTATVSVAVVPNGVGVLTNRGWVAHEQFDPVRTNNAAVATTVVDEPGGTLQMYRASAEELERKGSITFFVGRSDHVYGEISVGFATADGTAVAGEDYVATSGTLTLASGRTLGRIDVPVLDDGTSEDSETFSVSLFDPGGGAVLGSLTNAVATIDDDDGVAPFPFQESFESGVLSNYWRIDSTAAGAIWVTTNNGPVEGTRHLTMESMASGYDALNELVLTADLAGRGGVTLAFWHKQFSDEDHLMSATFSGHQNADGVAMSMDGTNWVKVQGLTAAEGSSNVYGYFEVALDPIAASNGLTYTSTFKIKFQQYDNYPIPTDGFAFDAISLFARHGELRFDQAAYEVAETGGVVFVSVDRANGSYGEVAVPYALADGTAIAGADYVAATGTLTFANGVSTGAFAVAVLDDADDEPAETVFLTLGAPTGEAILATPSNAVLTLLDDDGPGELAFSTNACDVVESNGTATIVVWRRGGAEGEVAVDVAATDGTATSGLDYLSATGTLTFAAGVTQQEFAVAILDDAEREDAETVALALANPTGGASLGSPETALLRIVDDEDPNYDYYLPAYGKTGPELRQALHDIIRGHVAFSYDTLWTVLQQTDECPTNSAQVQLVYLQIGRDKNNNGGYSGQWNREHVWPQSHGFPDALSTAVPPSVDAHHVKPADVEVNSLRGEKDFDDGGTHVAGAPASCLTTSSTFAPPDASKGDVARMLFYMDVRYSGDVDGEPDLQLVDAVDTSGTQLGRLSTLIRWHFLDPPDDFERHRNDLIYANWQGNRNPFIDHPEWVLKIWDYNVAIATVAGAHGGISPANPQVPYHADQEFVIAPEPHYHVADVRTNGVSLGAAYGTSAYAFVWSQIVTNGTVAADFAENLTAGHGVPETWLAAHDVTNEFDAAELDDPDGDGAATWQEYFMGTHPGDPDSVLRLDSIALALDGDAAVGYVLSWPTATGRVYDVEYLADPVGDAWQPLEGLTNLVSETGTLSVTNAFHDGSLRLLRLQVRLP